MAEISQRSVAQMTAVFERLGCYDDTSYTGIEAPLLSATELKRELYARDFDRAFLERCAPRNQWATRWDFDELLPQLHDGRFFNPPGQKRDWRAALEDQETLLRQREAIEKGRRVLLKFAEYLVDKANILPELRCSAEFGQLIQSLELDGFRLHGGKLVPADTAIFDQPKQVSLLAQQINLTQPASAAILLHHFANGEQGYLDGKFDTAVGDWRKFFEQLLRDIAEETSHNRKDLTEDAAKLTMKDVFAFLEKAGFLDSNERLAFSSSWAFLCSGAHPGVGKKDEAYLAMILSLSFGHVALSKFEIWKTQGYRSF